MQFGLNQTEQELQKLGEQQREEQMRKTLGRTRDTRKLERISKVLDRIDQTRQQDREQQNIEAQQGLERERLGIESTRASAEATAMATQAPAEALLAKAKAFDLIRGEQPNTIGFQTDPETGQRFATYGNQVQNITPQAPSQQEQEQDRAKSIKDMIQVFDDVVYDPYKGRSIERPRDKFGFQAVEEPELPSAVTKSRTPSPNEQPPVPGAFKDREGRWLVKDPRSGKIMRYKG